MTHRWIGIVLLMFASAIGCGDDDDDDGSTSTPRAGSGGSTTAGSGGQTGGDESTSEERVIEIVATEFRFTPDRIEAEPGETFIVSLRNAGADDHNIEFELPDGEFELDGDLGPGESARLSVDAPDESGEFEFYCPISGHRQLGMVGTLAVQ